MLAPVGRDSSANQSGTVRDVKGGEHIVRRGETLHAIAFRYGLDFRDVADWNQIRAPYAIYPGQRILVVQPESASKSASVASKAAKSSSTGVPASSPEKQPTRAKPAPEADEADEARDDETDVAVSNWRWPVTGRVLTTFGQSGRKGIDIEGKFGAPVRATADGKVVYSGGGLIGYGELIIIKHNKHYLSAYGHNEKLLVKQGDTVRLGQDIATMGDSGTDRVKLHFEIRRDGTPVDPTRYLPK